MARTSELVRAMAARGLGTLGQHLSNVGTAALVDTLADSSAHVRTAAAQALAIDQANTPIADRLEQEAIRVLHREPPVDLFRSLFQTQMVAIVGDMGRAIPAYIQQVDEALDWPFWQVQWQAACALGNLRRGIPDRTIAKLLAKWQQRDLPSVWGAVDVALAQ